MTGKVLNQQELQDGADNVHAKLVAVYLDDGSTPFEQAVCSALALILHMRAGVLMGRRFV